MKLDKACINYFDKSLAENHMFWSRFPGNLSFRGKFILDIGCGHGALCIDMASNGAKKVIGIDTNKQLIEFANNNLNQNFSELKHIVEFKVGEIKEFPHYEFDIITSKSAFEHIIDPTKCLKGIKLRLKPAGRVYIGFGPLYHSLLGDHGIIKLIFGLRIPWAHAILPESILVRRWNKKYPERKIKSITDLGLNKMSLSQFKNIFYKSGMRIVYFKVNRSRGIISNIFSLLRGLPFMEQYFSHNLYCILKND